MIPARFDLTLMRFLCFSPGVTCSSGISTVPRLSRGDLCLFTFFFFPYYYTGAYCLVFYCVLAKGFSLIVMFHANATKIHDHWTFSFFFFPLYGVLMIRCFFFFHQSRAGFLFGYILDIQRWSMLALHSHVLLGCFFVFSSVAAQQCSQLFFFCFFLY